MCRAYPSIAIAARWRYAHSLDTANVPEAAVSSRNAPLVAGPNSQDRDGFGRCVCCATRQRLKSTTQQARYNREGRWLMS
jgi:hypothetical protein